MDIKVCVFDAYGTLFDITSAARRCAMESDNKKFIEVWSLLSQMWREKQLSYSWLMTILGEYQDFWSITEDALDYALEYFNLSSDKNLKQRLMDLYKELAAYDEVKRVLTDLKKKNIVCAILSNGSPSMLNSAVKSAEIQYHIDAILSVDKIGVFKPKSEVYNMVVTQYKCDRKSVLFVSSNGWDIAGATHFGFNTFWVNRSNLPLERLPFKPHSIGKDLTSINV